MLGVAESRALGTHQRMKATLMMEATFTSVLVASIRIGMAIVTQNLVIVIATTIAPSARFATPMVSACRILLARTARSRPL